jgi:nicotinamide-nucleotide amidase
MNAVVVAVGSELLRPARRDTNGDWLIARLFDLGIEAQGRTAVGDDVSRIARTVRAALEEAGTVVVTGGLGPTEDDKTREAIAHALGAPLTHDAVMAERIIALFTLRGRMASPRQSRQADRPLGMEWIDNPLGSAPGLLLQRKDGVLAVLPGVPAEMKAMFEASVAPRLAVRSRLALARTTLRVAGRPESAVDDLLRDLYESEGTETTILASAGSVELLLTARGSDPREARSRLTALADAMRGRLGIDLYGADDESLPVVVSRLLRVRGATVAVAESCTGGLLGAALTDVPGSSAWFRGGLVCYANDLKTSLAGVPEKLLRAHGAVSGEVARALAAGARTACSADFGLGVTGVAGPDGGTADKPVGTVHIALDDGGPGRMVKLDWPGDRELIRRRAVTVALDLLRRRLLA